MAFKMNGMNFGMGTGSEKTMMAKKSMYKKDPGSTEVKAKPTKDTTSNYGTGDGSKVKSMYKKDEPKMSNEDWQKGKDTAKALGSDLNSLVAQRKNLTKGSEEYNVVQNKINQALGSKKRHSTESKNQSSKNTTTFGTEKDKVNTKGDDGSKDKNVTTYYPSGEKKKDKVVTTDADGNKQKRMVKYNKDGTEKKRRGYDYNAPGK